MRRMLLAILALTLIVSVGCGSPISMAGSAGKTAFKAIRGAQAELTPIRVSQVDTWAAYRTLQAGEVTTDVPPLCTPQILSKVRAGISKGMADEDVREAFAGGGKTLRFDVMCRLYRERGMFGGEARLDWLVTLVDVESNQALGTVFIEGASESVIEHGVGDMAKENTQELVKYLRKQN